MPLAPAQPNFGPTNPVVANLFRQAQHPMANIIKRGTLISFNYVRWKHDPYPLLIVTDLWPGRMVRGVNLHYLTFPYIRNVLNMGADKASFSYGIFKQDRYISNAFRSYKWDGVRQVRTLDTQFLLTVMASVRSFDPNQIRAIRQMVQEQIRRVVNPKAGPTPEMGM